MVGRLFRSVCLKIWFLTLLHFSPREELASMLVEGMSQVFGKGLERDTARKRGTNLSIRPCIAEP